VIGRFGRSGEFDEERREAVGRRTRDRSGNGLKPPARSGDPAAEFARALTAPGRPDELAGMDVAVSAFRQAADTPPRTGATDAAATAATATVATTAPPRRERHRRTRLRPRPAVAALIGGLILAATTATAERGALPDRAQQMAHTVLGGIGVPEHRHHARPDQASDPGAPARPSPAPNRSGAAPRSTAPTTSPTVPSLLDLCEVVLVDQKGLHSKTMDPESRNRLSAAAGGEDQIVQYCEKALTTAGIPYLSPAPTSDASPRQPSPAPRRSSNR
jgi:hypothetical protein